MDPIKRLAQFFELLPGVGPRTAQRYVYFLLSLPFVKVKEFGELLLLMEKEIHQCQKCFNFSQELMCKICSSLARDQSMLCVVAKPQDIESIEKAETYHGLYFVLGGLLHPLRGIEAHHLRFSELLKRINDNPVQLKELILAMNPSLEGEQTIRYIKKITQAIPLQLSILARGLPQGAELEYADEITLLSALTNRKIISE